MDQHQHRRHRTPQTRERFVLSAQDGGAEFVAGISGCGKSGSGAFVAGICGGGDGSGGLLVADICGGGDGSGGLLMAGICGGGDGNCCDMPQIKAIAVAATIKMRVFMLIHLTIFS